MIVTAPGKIVLWGEYAVLAGAPAAVAAVDRYASVELEPLEAGWEFVSEGFLTPSLHKASSAFSGAPVAAFAEAALERLGCDQLPGSFACRTDTSAFYQQGAKLGIGSSAAVCTATYYAFARWLEREPVLEDALALHRDWQGGRGSGLDVAASWHGGVIDYRMSEDARPSVRPLRLTPELRWAVVWTCSGASTAAQLTGFSAWRRRGNTAPLERLAELARALTEGEPSLPLLASYRDALHELSTAAGLKIFTHEHDQLGKIAADFGLVYKPCGAGGGDIGVAFGCDAEALAGFVARVDESPFQPIEVETAKHGVEVSD